MAALFERKLIIKIIAFLSILLVAMSNRLNAQEETDIYRWVDESGNVHYSDLPQNEEAQLITVKKGSSASVVKSDVAFTDLSEKLSTTKAPRNNTILVNNNESYQAEASSCDYLKSELKKSQKLMKGNNASKAKQAANHVETLKIMLIQGQCE